MSRILLATTAPADPAYPLLSRIRAEYLEMPGLSLTVRQAQRLFGGEGPSCKAVLDRLVEDRFLFRQPNGTYARVIDGPRLRRALA